MNNWPKDLIIDALRSALTGYRNKHSTTELTNRLVAVCRGLDNHGHMPARTSPGRAWAQIVAWTCATVNAGTYLVHRFTVLLDLVEALQKDGYNAFADKISDDAP